jgi:hypothetical protein
MTSYLAQTKMSLKKKIKTENREIEHVLSRWLIPVGRRRCGEGEYGGNITSIGK